MKPLYLRYALLSVIFFALYACGQSKKATISSNSSNYIDILDASVQRRFLGVRAAEPITDYKLHIVWKHGTPPDSLFWKTSNGWMKCMVYRFNGKAQRGMDVHDIQKGDTLELIPSRTGKYSVPAGIPSNVGNAIFFKISNTNWLYSLVNNLTKKPDIVMP